MTNSLKNNDRRHAISMQRWGLVIMALLLVCGCGRVGTPGRFVTGAGQKFGGVNDNGHFFGVTLSNDCLSVDGRRPGVNFGLFRSRPEGQAETKWSVPWVIINEVTQDSDSSGGPSTSGASKTEPYRFELTRTFEYDQGSIDFSWAADCSGTTPQIASLTWNNNPVDLAQGSLFILTLDENRQVVVTQKKWQGEFPNKSLAGSGEIAPPIGRIGDSIMVELGY
ncbi:MAG: hypothetical protein VX764_05910 [Planctomycetota bacterium]|nr:hypothetical protein [Planctomycetota bacterium]